MKSVLLSAILLGAATLTAQTAPAPQAPADHPLARHYRDGESLTYRMTASNDDWHYTVLATSVVKKNPDGIFIENVQWSGMTSNGQPVTLAPGSADFRQPISLDTNRNPSGPDLSHVDPRLVGPITDLMTFYVDLWLANKIGIFQHAGDHFYVPNPQPSSWADGTRVITGEDLIDFDVTLKSIDPAAHTAILVVHHVPPPHSNLPLAAAWMQTPIADTPNNWVEVTKTQEGKYQAGVGKETFDVQVTVCTGDGKILAATMDNPVVTSGRTCDDAALTHCADSQSHTIHRHVEIALVPNP